EAFGSCKQLLALGAANCSSFYSRHLTESCNSEFRIQNADTVFISEFCILTSALHTFYLYGSIRSSFGASAGDTSFVPRMWRFDLVVLPVRMWRLKALPR